MKPVSDKRVFHALDAARGIAALVVIVYHLPGRSSGQAFTSAYLAVDFFFLLSGFVLAHAYRDSLVSGELGYREFAMIRLLRLYPLYLISLIGLLVWLMLMTAFSRPIPWSGVALIGKLPFALVMLPSPSLDPNGYLYPFNIAAWSIFFELAVNGVFAIACRRVRRASTLWLIIAASGGLLLLQILAANELGGPSWSTLLGGMARVTFSFFLGVQLHQWHRRAPESLSAANRAWRVANGLPSLLALGLLFAVLYVPLPLGARIATIFVVFPLLVLLLSVCELPSGPVGAALRQLGVISYALYVLHGPLLLAWTDLRSAHGPLEPPNALSVVALLALITAIAWAADRWFDRRLRSALQLRLRPGAGRAHEPGSC